MKELLTLSLIHTKKQKKDHFWALKLRQINIKNYLETFILITTVKSITPICSSMSDECGGR